MASSSSSSKFHHARSNSLPSRPHPVTTQLENHIDILRASESTCSTSSLTGKLRGVQELHECIEELLSLPIAHKALCNGERWVEELLDGSLRLLDLCSAAKTGLLQTKEALQELQSSMRRRKAGENANEVRKYLSTRKSVQKAIKKAISSMQSRKDESLARHGKDDEVEAFASLLGEAEVASSSVLESTLCVISGLRKPSSSSLISKMMLKKRAFSEAENEDANELAKQDAVLKSLVAHRTSKVHDLTQVEQLQNSLKNLENDIEDLEEGLESVYRRLIKSRVFLLNILNC